MQFEIAHIKSLFDNATEGFIVTDSSGSIIMANPSACRMFDYELGELVGQKIELLIPSRYRQHHVDLRKEFYNDPHNRVMGHGRDLHGEKKGGTDFPVEVSLSTYTWNDERYVIAFIIDITRRKEIEMDMVRQKDQLQLLTAQMRKLNTELEAKVEERTTILKEALHRLEESQQELSDALDKERQLNEIKSRFVSMASHEFRTPLSTVLSSATLISKYTKEEDQDKRARHIQKIKDSVKHLNNLLEDFLSLGRLEEGKVGTNFRELNIVSLVHNIIDEMNSQLKPGQLIDASHHGDENIITDPNFIKNILINLISNASKFSEEGRKITVSSSISSNQLSLSVADQGIGIPEDEKSHLFSSFFRAKNATNIQGTGLGLHIVKRYIDLLGGTVLLESELSKGTKITVNIPGNEPNLAVTDKSLV